MTYDPPNTVTRLMIYLTYRPLDP